MLGGSIVGSLFGFLFWLICAHFTSSSQVGYAATLLAYISLFSTVTTLGLSNTVIRFLPKHKNKDAYFSTVLTITLVSSILLGSILLYSIKYLSPKLLFAVSNPQIFGLLLLILVISSIGTVADSSLLSQKDAKNVFIKALWQSPIRVLIPFVFITLNVKNILVIYALTTLVGLAYELTILYSKHHQRFSFDLSTLSNSYKFTAGNFTGTIFGIIPSTLVPIIVLNRLGPSLAAYFYIAMQIASLLSLVSSSSAQAYLSEASNDHDSQYMHHFVKAFKNLYYMLVPAALLTALVGTQILRFYGYAYYSHGAVLLLLLCFSSIFIGINWLGDSLLNVQKRPFAYSVMNFINALLVIVLVLFTASDGLVAVGLSVIAAQVITVAVYIGLQMPFLRTYKLTRLA